jgi:ribosomal protein S18 acetylase RimI-like enzyme
LGDLKVKAGFSVTQADRVAELFDEAFASKFSKAIPLQNERLQFWRESINPDQVFTVFQENELIGVALFATSNSSGFRAESGKILHKQLGILRFIRAGAIFSLFSYTPKPEEMYIEAISVHSNARGLGAGKLLLDKLTERAQSESHKSLTLKVILENERARKLYEREGFQVIKTKSSRIINLVSGVAGAHQMEKIL